MSEEEFSALVMLLLAFSPFAILLMWIVDIIFRFPDDEIETW